MVCGGLGWFAVVWGGLRYFDGALLLWWQFYVIITNMLVLTSDNEFPRCALYIEDDI